jgi:hypothetical protein
MDEDTKVKPTQILQSHDISKFPLGHKFIHRLSKLEAHLQRSPDGLQYFLYEPVYGTMHTFPKDTTSEWAPV